MPSLLDGSWQEPGSGSLSVHSSAAAIEVVLFCETLPATARAPAGAAAFPPLDPLADLR